MVYERAEFKLSTISQQINWNTLISKIFWRCLTFVKAHFRVSTQDYTDFCKRIITQMRLIKRVHVLGHHSTNHALIMWNNTFGLRCCIRVCWFAFCCRSHRLDKENNTLCGSESRPLVSVTRRMSSAACGSTQPQSTMPRSHQSSHFLLILIYNTHPRPRFILFQQKSVSFSRI